MDEPVPDTPPSATISSEDAAPKESSESQPVKDAPPSSAKSSDDAGPKEPPENETVKETPLSDSKSSENAASEDSAEDKKQSKTSSVLPPVAKARYNCTTQPEPFTFEVGNRGRVTAIQRPGKALCEEGPNHFHTSCEHLCYVCSAPVENFVLFRNRTTLLPGSGTGWTRMLEFRVRV